MTSHPNYKGYDATEGNPHARPEKPKMHLTAHMGRLTAKDLYLDVPKGWLVPLNEIVIWCDQRDIDFCPSPFPYQIAKLISGEFTIVLWASKHKKHRTKFIKPAFEGPVNGFGAEEAMNAVRRIIG